MKITKYSQLRDGKLVHVAIFTYAPGNKVRFQSQFTTFEDHFHPYEGWELKDCVTMSLPDEWKYACVQKILSSHPFYALIVRPE